MKHVPPEGFKGFTALAMTSNKIFFTASEHHLGPSFDKTNWTSQKVENVTMMSTVHQF